MWITALRFPGKMMQPVSRVKPSQLPRLFSSLFFLSFEPSPGMTAALYSPLPGAWVFSFPEVSFIPPMSTDNKHRKPNWNSTFVFYFQIKHKFPTNMSRSFFIFWIILWDLALSTICFYRRCLQPRYKRIWRDNMSCALHALYEMYKRKPSEKW